MRDMSAMQRFKSPAHSGGPSPVPPPLPKFKTALLAAALFLRLAPCAVAQAPLPAQEPSGEPYLIKVSVNLVALHVAALNHQGTPVSGLTAGQFRVFEDGVPQKITQFSTDDIPVTVGLVVDNSGSMKNKRTDVVAAALEFARTSNPRDQMFVVNFNERVSFALPPSVPFTDNPAQLEKALSRMNPIGQTALYDAVQAALEHLRMSSLDKKVLIIISDGGDNVSKASLPQVMALAEKSDAVIYSIGIFDQMDGDNNPAVLRTLARRTGGESFFPETSASVTAICERIAHDIRSQYSISYVPSNTRLDGRYRNIEVKVSAPGHGHVTARTRTGYVAPTATPPLPTKEPAQ